MSERGQPDRWIRTLAEPYLRGYRAVSEKRSPLRGYRFLSRGKTGARSRLGFFVGYLLEKNQVEFLAPRCPECIVFVFVEPADGTAHRRLVSAQGSLLRHTWEYIRWLTHRGPRFVFFEDREIVLVRHIALREWPEENSMHYARNFFIETLAWLVRSGLVKMLLTSGTQKPSLRHLPKSISFQNQ